MKLQKQIPTQNKMYIFKYYNFIRLKIFNGL